MCVYVGIDNRDEVNANERKYTEVAITAIKVFLMFENVLKLFFLAFDVVASR